MVARRFPTAWLLLAQLHEESGGADALDNASTAIRSYLERAEGAAAKAGWAQLASLYRRSENAIGELNALVQYCLSESADLAEISDSAERINRLCYEHRLDFERDSKEVLRRVIDAFETKASQATAIDLSRLAWLYLQLRDEDGARRAVRRALRLDSGNYHVRNLAEKLRLEQVAPD
jgi:hypothetical protein